MRKLVSFILTIVLLFSMISIGLAEQVDGNSPWKVFLTYAEMDIDRDELVKKLDNQKIKYTQDSVGYNRVLIEDNDNDKTVFNYLVLSSGEKLLNIEYENVKYVITSNITEEINKRFQYREKGTTAKKYYSDFDELLNEIREKEDYASTTEENNTEFNGNQYESDLQTYVGKIVTFGNYPQTSSGIDRTPIDWIVLDYNSENSSFLLISQYGLDAKEYHDVTQEEQVAWENSSLREWLNGDFLNIAFNEVEHSAIMMTTISNDISQGSVNYGSEGGNDTQDSIFLLSYGEACYYYDVQDPIVGVEIDEEKSMNSRVAPTEYAIAQGAYVGKNMTNDGEKSGFWWLRTPAARNSAVIIDSNGTSNMNPYVFHDKGWRGCVRPSLWVDSDYVIRNNAISNTKSITENSQSEIDEALFKQFSDAIVPYIENENNNNFSSKMKMWYDENNNRYVILRYSEAALFLAAERLYYPNDAEFGSLWEQFKAGENIMIALCAVRINQTEKKNSGLFYAIVNALPDQEIIDNDTIIFSIVRSDCNDYYQDPLIFDKVNELLKSW